MVVIVVEVVVTTVPELVVVVVVMIVVGAARPPVDKSENTAIACIPALTSAAAGREALVLAGLAAVLSTAWEGSKARAGSRFSYGGVRRRSQKVIDLIEVFDPNPNFTCPPQGVQAKPASKVRRLVGARSFKQRRVEFKT